MSAQVRLPDLSQWYEDNIERATTLSIVRCLFQGNFPREPVSSFTSLGADWALFEDLRTELGDSEFQIYIQCQLEAFGRNRLNRRFYPSYCVEEGARDRYRAAREKIRYSGYHSFRSEIYRAVFPAECSGLREYFRRWLLYEGPGSEPNWWDLKTELALKSHPYWAFFGCDFTQAKDRGDEFLAIWLAGKKRLMARHLMSEAHECDRACIDALVFIAEQTSPLARDFILAPLEEESLAYQTARQFHDRRARILSAAPVLKITVEGR